MALDIIPGSFWNFPSIKFPSFLSDDEDWVPAANPSGLSISEDDKHVYVAAAMPGIEEDDIEITFNKGILWIKGEANEEDGDKRKYYRRSTRSFSYRVGVPGDIDASLEPEATYKNGMMTVAFAKSPTSQPKKIAIKKSK